MVEREVEVINSLGIHARPSSLIVQTAMKYKSAISLKNKDVVADAKSIMSIMILAAACGSRIIISAEGEDEQSAVDAIAALFEQKFNEE
jgi:phosphocarrier protein HPr